MRKTYSTDLSDEEWTYIEPHLPVPGAPGRPRLHTLREVLDAIFYIVRGGCAWRLRLAAAPGGCCPTTSLLGRPPTTTSALGVWMAPGRGCTQPYASACGCAWTEIPSRAPGWWTPSRSRPPAWAEKSAVTMGPRRSRGANAIYWWTRKDWCSKRGSTAPRWWIGTASSFC